jgi:hypothetical protein
MHQPTSSEPLTVEIVGHVNSNYPDAWRTKEDYIHDQVQQRKLVHLQIATLLVAVAGLLASSYFQYQSSKEKQTVVVEVVHKHIQVPPEAAPSASAQAPTAASKPANTPPPKSN